MYIHTEREPGFSPFLFYMGQEQSPCQETLPTAGSSWLWICGDQMIISMISAST